MMTRFNTDETGIQRWYADGQLHRNDGPAVIYTDGSAMWYQHGKKHRDNAPAITYPDGTEYWYQHGLAHRDGGPAVTWADGSEAWYKHDKRHRIDGPAFTDESGHYWYIEGRWIDNWDDFRHLSGLPDEDIILLKLKYGDMG